MAEKGGEDDDDDDTLADSVPTEGSILSLEPGPAVAPAPRFRLLLL